MKSYIPIVSVFIMILEKEGNSNFYKSRKQIDGANILVFLKIGWYNEVSKAV